MMDEGDEPKFKQADKFPMLDDASLELESMSDSSDWHHEGNGIPCRFYNRDGCLRGTDCRFSHAPDHKSVRDRLYVSLGFFIGSALVCCPTNRLTLCSGGGTFAFTSY